jgi:phosphatidyl-myo-inositol dimannoside synthase
VWTSAPGSSFEKWQRYLAVFEEVLLLVRTCRVAQPPEGWVRMSAAGITPIPLPYFEGAWEYMRRLPAICRTARTALETNRSCGVIVRAPHLVSDAVVEALEEGRPFGVELVGDPYSVFAGGGVPLPLGRSLGTWYGRRTRRICRSACAVSYVTQRVLQERYPASGDAFTCGCSSIELPVSAIRLTPRHAQGPPFVVLHAGSMTNLNKGQDLLLHALKILSGNGVPIRARLVGDGRLRPWFEGLAAQLGIRNDVEFPGQLPGPQAVWREMDRADLFVMPSRSEGLPRVLIEALARGLPSIGARTGGIIELLPESSLFPAGDPAAISSKIEEVLSAPAHREALSTAGLAIARQFTSDRLGRIRGQFYRHVETRTTDWLRSAVC